MRIPSLCTRGLAIASMVVLALPLVAQEPVDAAVNAKIRAEGLQHSHALAMVDTIATVFGPRLTGSPAFKAAVDWTQREMSGIGLANAHIESWPFAHGWELDDLTLDMVSPRFMPLIGYAEAWTPSTKGEIVGAPLVLGGRTQAELDRAKDSIAGAIVMPAPMVTRFIDVNRLQPSAPDASPSTPTGAPRAPGTGEQQAVTRLLAATPPAVVIHPSTGKDGTIFVQGGRYNGTATAPSIIMSGEQYNMIMRMVADHVPVKLRVNVKTHFLEQDKNGYNVIGELPGVDPVLKDQVVMVGAHLDSWHTATGATDNADGVATVLEAMRILKAIGVKPRRTIRVAIWGGEEEGLLGSKAWVDRHLAGDSNAVARSKMSMYLNLDPGTGPVYGIYMQGNQAATPIFDRWLEPWKDLGARRNVPQSIGNTDHLSFTDVGVPGFNAIQDYDDYDIRMHHTNMDTMEHVTEDGLKEAAIVYASFLYHAAMRDEMMPRPPR